MFRTVVMFALVGALAACETISSLPPAPIQHAADGTRVGIVAIGLDRSAIHQHVGTTVFNNFSVEKTLPWHLGERVKEKFSTELTKRGLNAIVLEASELRQVDADQLIVKSGSRGWLISAEADAVVRDLRENHKIDALIVVTAKPTLASIECSGGPCTRRMLPKTGLFSRSVFNINSPS